MKCPFFYVAKLGENPALYLVPPNSLETFVRLHKSLALTVWQVGHELAPTDVTESLIKLFEEPEVNDDAPRGRSTYTEHAIGWENV